MPSTHVHWSVCASSWVHAQLWVSQMHHAAYPGARYEVARLSMRSAGPMRSAIVCQGTHCQPLIRRSGGHWPAQSPALDHILFNVHLHASHTYNCRSASAWRACRARMAASLASSMLARASTRCRCTSAGALTTATASTCQPRLSSRLWPPQRPANTAHTHTALTSQRVA